MLKQSNPLYKDIEINENFTFDKDENLIFNKPPSAEQIQALIANNNDEPHLLTQDVDIQPILNVEDETPDGTAMEQYKQYALQKCPYLPQDINMKHIDALSFPELHTSGNFGFDHERKPKVTKRQYIRNRLKNANRRFATNAKWLTFCQGLLEIKDIKSSISTQARIGKDKLKGENLVKMLESEDETLQQCMSSQFAALRGHKAYWQQVKLDLKAHIAIFGAPNWFLTLNPSEKDWKELHEAYSKVKGIEVNSSNIRDLIAEDPVIWCRHFQKRVKEFFKRCLLVENCTLGKVTNYFYRIEYQHR
uniref:Helitron helicase-like domain-containing protein n=1 Tax=Panagrolaimus superbus TaxID=310955 RepID=A0A914YMU8_9BILA